MIAPPTHDEIAAYRDLFRSELDKNMHNSSGSPSTDAHTVALHAFVQARNNNAGGRPTATRGDSATQSAAPLSSAPSRYYAKAANPTAQRGYVVWGVWRRDPAGEAWMCECGGPEYAEQIAASLNAQSESPSIPVAVLREHWLHQVECDHERKMDRPICACSTVDLGWHASVGAAVEVWLMHVQGVPK